MVRPLAWAVFGCDSWVVVTFISYPGAPEQARSVVRAPPVISARVGRSRERQHVTSGSASTAAEPWPQSTTTRKETT
jgi:hypothetical protein